MQYVLLKPSKLRTTRYKKEDVRFDSIAAQNMFILGELEKTDVYCSSHIEEPE